MLPVFTFSTEVQAFGVPESGELLFSYGPFINLINPTPLEDLVPTPLVPLRLNSFESGINVTEPLSLEIESSYDDSVNLVITDHTNPPKIVNSRFYLSDSTHYKIADRKGNLDTNIYSKENFKIESSLIQTVRTISQLTFLGVKDGGQMKVGSYTFYFKLADADGNESDFIAESGKVVCHIGATNNPNSIRGGLKDENSNKLVKFILKNVDLAYDYVNIYYTRTTGDETNEITYAYKIVDKVKINGQNVNIVITGYEVHEPIDISDVNIQLVNFESAKTVANCQNITFLGNTSNNYELFTTLEKLSLLIIPEIVYDSKGIGNLDKDYIDQTGGDEDCYEYYNTRNIYYKLGYWDEEIYRFGVVYILPDNTLSPVFNIRGIKELTNTSTFSNFDINSIVESDEDYSIIGTNINNPENIKGVFKIVSNQSDEGTGTFNSQFSIKPLGIKFNFTGSSILGMGKYIPGLKHLTKGFFIVRQKRIPTILAQGVGIATSSKTYLPLFRANATTTPPNPSTPEGQIFPIDGFGFPITSKYFMQSFLQNPRNNPYQTVLGPNIIDVGDKILNNALLCPEATLRSHIFENIFNSSEFTLNLLKYQPLLINNEYASGTPSGEFSFSSVDNNNAIHFKNINLIKYSDVRPFITTKVSFIRPGIDLTSLDGYKFSSKAGDSAIGYLFKDPIYGDYQDSLSTTENLNSDDQTVITSNAVRGEFNSYLGLNKEVVKNGKYYNIMEKGYNFSSNWRQYFLLRYNNSSPYFAISDRFSWDNFSDSLIVYRGDCYINTYTHRMNWNFIDPELPTNTKIIDKYTWSKNIRIVSKKSKYIDGKGQQGESIDVFNKLLPMFTFRSEHIREFDGDDQNNETLNHDNAILEPDNKRFKKYSEANGIFGFEKLNRPDINAVPLGIWATFKICSNVNLAMRDVEFKRPDEEALHGVKRSFHPYQTIDIDMRLPESTNLNVGISKTTGDKMYFEIPDVPFIKTNFSTRINYSNILRKGVFDNGNRIFESGKYIDYSREYGALIKLLEWRGKLMGIMEHGVLLIPVNERALMANASGENVAINTSNVLPENPMVLSNTFGSVWPESIIKTSRYVYGIDTVAKKIWRTDGNSFDNISDIKIQKFLNDNILIKEIEKDRRINKNFVKTHYDAGKYDIIFTLKYNNISWSLCWNELTNKWVTQYTWFPEFSENINNIFCTFANQEKHSLSSGKLYYHRVLEGFGESGNSTLLPAYWYDTQYPFELEFVVSATPGVQKIFNNLKIISNLAEPYSFYYEVVGEGYDFNIYKYLIYLLNDVSLRYVEGIDMDDLYDVPKTEDVVKSRYKRFLAQKSYIKKLPYIYTQSYDVNDTNSFFRDRGNLTIPFTMASLKDMNLRKHNKSSEILMTSYQKGSDLKKYGRLKGNMQYLEDSWDVQIQPFSIKYAYVQQIPSGRTSEPPDPVLATYWELKFTDFKSMDIRDKYIKIRIKYKGDQLVVINALRTLYTISYA